MVDREPNPFDPAVNPNMEYIPYDQDPAILAGASGDDQISRNLAQRVRAWQDARYELARRPDDPAAQTSLQFAEQNLEAHLQQLGLRRGIREKTDPGGGLK